MTEAINYFQSMFTMGNMSSNNLSKNDIRLMRELRKEAHRTAAQARAEVIHGQKAARLVNGSTSSDIVQIALWHFEEAASKYRRAVDWMEQACKLSRQTRRETLLRSEAKKLRVRVIKVDAALTSIKSRASRRA